MAFIIKVDEEACIGCGACAAMCENFQVSGGKSHPIKPEVEELGCEKEAAESCPVGAIKIEEK
jgi:ferredoxin